MSQGAQNKAIFFSPYAGIWPHAFPEALVAAELRRAGSELIYVTCDGLLSSGCVAMFANNVTPRSSPEEREKICFKCRAQRDLLLKNLNVREIRLESLVSPEVRDDIEKRARTVSPETAYGFEYQGLPVGRYALLEPIVHFKVNDLSQMTPAFFDEFKNGLRHIMMVVWATRKLLEEHRPDEFVLYHANIATNYALMNCAEREGIRVHALHAGGNIMNSRTSLYIYKRDAALFYRTIIAAFEGKVGALPLSADAIDDAAAHFLGLTGAKSVFVYSAPKKAEGVDVRRFFNVGDRQQVVLATLSSYDELFSSQVMGVLGHYSLMFKDQVEWVTELIAWAETRPDICLIIRVHPREFPNKRDSVHSNHAKRLQATLTDLPSNVRINWPTDGISIYDLAMEVDVGLNAWSSVGHELALLGIPVVLFGREALAYPASLNILAEDREDYFRCIDAALKSGWSYEIMRDEFRWLATDYYYSTISIRDGFNPEEPVPLSRREKLEKKIRKLLGLKKSENPLRTERAQARALRRPLRNGRTIVRTIVDDIPFLDLHLESLQPLTPEEEKRAIQEKIREILDKVYHNTPPDQLVMKRLRTFVETGDEGAKKIRARTTPAENR